jgi:hypothetical protein
VVRCDLQGCDWPPVHGGSGAWPSAGGPRRPCLLQAARNRQRYWSNSCFASPEHHRPTQPPNILPPPNRHCNTATTLTCKTRKSISGAASHVRPPNKAPPTPRRVCHPLPLKDTAASRGTIATTGRITATFASRTPNNISLASAITTSPPFFPSGLVIDLRLPHNTPPIPPKCLPQSSNAAASPSPRG